MRAGKAVCVIGETVRQKLFHQQNPVGADIRLKGFACPVIGLLAAKGPSAMGSDQDDVIVMPIPAVQRRLTGSQDVGMLLLSVKAGASADPAPLPPASRTAHELVVAGIAIRRLRTKAARAALARAERAAHDARIPALTAEVESAFLVLNTPTARLIASGEERALLLEEVEALLASNAFVVDACRHVVRRASTVVSLAKRSVLFALARALSEAWSGDLFFCGGGRSGKVRTVRRPKRGSAAGSGSEIRVDSTRT